MHTQELVTVRLLKSKPKRGTVAVVDSKLATPSKMIDFKAKLSIN